MNEFMELFGEWGTDVTGTPLPLSVKTYEGSGPMGAKFSEPRDHAGLPQFPQQRLVRTSDGNEKVSQSAVYAPLELAGDFTLHSLVTLADGHEAAILTVATADQFGLFGFVVLNLE